jgi:hypothetical protein
MTTAELNCAVATLRGWTRIDDEVGRPPDVAYGLRWPDYATDPAAWGSLYQALADEGFEPSLAHTNGEYIAGLTPHGTTMRVVQTDESYVGVALCRAYVASMGNDWS